MDFVRENPPSHGQVVNFEQLIRKTPPVYGQTELFESTFYSNRFMVASQTASQRKKLNIQADSPKLVKPSSGIGRGELRSTWAERALAAAGQPSCHQTSAEMNTRLSSEIYNNITDNPLTEN